MATALIDDMLIAYFSICQLWNFIAHHLSMLSVVIYRIMMQNEQIDSSIQFNNPTAVTDAAPVITKTRPIMEQSTLIRASEKNQELKEERLKPPCPLNDRINDPNDIRFDWINQKVLGWTVLQPPPSPPPGKKKNIIIHQRVADGRWENNLGFEICKSINISSSRSSNAAYNLYR